MIAKALVVSALVVVGSLATPTGAGFSAPAQWGPTEQGPKPAGADQAPTQPAASTYCQTPHYHCAVPAAPIGATCWCGFRGPSGQAQSESGQHVGAPN